MVALLTQEYPIVSDVETGRDGDGPSYWTCWKPWSMTGTGCLPPRSLGVIYRTLAFSCDSREVSRRLRQALLDFKDVGGADEGADVAPELAGDDVEERDGDALELRVATLEAKNAGLRELADSQAGWLEELSGAVAVGRKWATARHCQIG